MNMMITPKPDRWFLIDSIDMSGIGSAIVTGGWQFPLFMVLILNQDGCSDGPVIGSGSLVSPAELQLRLNPARLGQGRHNNQ